jgi:hypothetical protein
MLAVAAGMAGCASAEAETAGPMHLEITGQHRLRITYDYTAVWPRGGGYSAAMDRAFQLHPHRPGADR